MNPARLSVIAALLAVAVYAWGVGTRTGREFDRAVLEQTPVAVEAPLSVLMFVIVNPLTVLVAGLMAVRRATHDSGPRAAAGVALALGGTILGAFALKSGLGALDPLEGEQRRALGASFFPSGHAGIVMTLGLIVIHAAAPDRRPGVALIVGLVTGVLGSLIFLADNHLPLDIVGGALLAGASAAALVVWWPPLAVPSRPQCATPTVLPRRLTASAVAAVAAVALVLGMLLWRPQLGAATLAVMLTAVALAIGFERSLSRVRPRSAMIDGDG